MAIDLDEVGELGEDDAVDSRCQGLGKANFQADCALALEVPVSFARRLVRCQIKGVECRSSRVVRSIDCVAFVFEMNARPGEQRVITFDELAFFKIGCEWFRGDLLGVHKQAQIVQIKVFKIERVGFVVRIERFVVNKPYNNPLGYSSEVKVIDGLILQSRGDGDRLDVDPGDRVFGW